LYAVPYCNAILFLYLLLKKGTEGGNVYGTPTAKSASVGDVKNSLSYKGEIKMSGFSKFLCFFAVLCGVGCAWAVVVAMNFDLAVGFLGLAILSVLILIPKRKNEKKKHAIEAAERQRLLVIENEKKAAEEAEQRRLQEIARQKAAEEESERQRCWDAEMEKRKAVEEARRREAERQRLKSIVDAPEKMPDLIQIPSTRSYANKEEEAVNKAFAGYLGRLNAITSAKAHISSLIEKSGALCALGRADEAESLREENVQTQRKLDDLQRKEADSFESSFYKLFCQNTEVAKAYDDFAAKLPKFETPMHTTYFSKQPRVKKIRLKVVFIIYRTSNL
jgi:hypothetical protein